MKNKLYFGIGFGFAFSLSCMYVVFKTGILNLMPLRIREYLIIPIILIGGVFFVVGVLIYNKLFHEIESMVLRRAESENHAELIHMKALRLGFRLDKAIGIISMIIYKVINF
ncbi:MAG: hypothetical protein ACI4JA_10875 [Oscillospiraceae bacterium]